MKGLKTIAIIGGITVAAVGAVLAATNPGQDAYEQFATEQLTAYLETNLCEKRANELDLASQCKSLLRSNQSRIREFIADGTERRNYLLFSTYTTNLSVLPFLPSYRFESVGVLRQFHVYEAKQS
jgi:hypothetical protein